MYGHKVNHNFNLGCVSPVNRNFNDDKLCLHQKTLKSSCLKDEVIRLNNRTNLQTKFSLNKSINCLDS